jgi:hypothetical protein
MLTTQTITELLDINRFEPQLPQTLDLDTIVNYISQ